jgi:hypothetical protein
MIVNDKQRFKRGSDHDLLFVWKINGKNKKSVRINNNLAKIRNVPPGNKSRFSPLQPVCLV